MRMIICGSMEDREVIGLPFEIEGSTEKFAVHASLSGSKGEWSATHIETGFAFAHGDTIDETIAKARQRWAGGTPDQHQEAIERAHKLRALPPIERGIK